MFDDFLEAQRKKRELLGDWLLDFTDDIRMIVRGACDSVLDDFLEGNNIVADHKMYVETDNVRHVTGKLTNPFAWTALYLTGHSWKRQHCAQRAENW